METKEKAGISVKVVIQFGKSIKKRLVPIVAISQAAVADKSKATSAIVRFELAEALYDEFHEIYSRISSNAKDTTEDLESLDAIVTEIDDVFYSIKAYVQDIHIKYKLGDKTNVSNSQIVTSKVNLPTLNIPPFSGDLKEFPSFFELFTSVVHNRGDLSDAEKFYHLQTYLKGSASMLIKGLTLTADNYLIAIDLLKDRYMNSRVLSHEYLNSINSIKPSTKAAGTLRHVIDTFQDNYKAFNALQLTETEKLEFLWFDLLLQKIDPSTRERFELTLSNKQLPSIVNLLEFLEKHCRAWETTFHCRLDTNRSKSNEPKKPTYSFLTKFVSCCLCKANHHLHTCKLFLSKSPMDRFEIIKSCRLCINCLNPSHSVSQCTSLYRCKTCQIKHHTLLHFPKRDVKQVEKVAISENTNPSTSVNLMANTSLTHRTTVLLSTALIDVRDTFGNFHTLRALLDTGSQANFITESCIQKLGLQRAHTQIPIQGINSMSSCSPRGITSCTLKPVHSNQPHFTVECIILSKICADMPSSVIPHNSCWKHLSNLKLADPNYGIPSSIDLLLGADVFSSILTDGKLQGNDTAPTALNTLFGWILLGKIGVQNQTQVNSLCTTLDFDLRRFWELEQVPSKIILSPEDHQAEQIFDKNYFLNHSGRFVVPLLFKDNAHFSFAGSYEIAQRRFASLERRLSQNCELRSLYCDFMKDYLEAGHMKKISVPTLTSNSYYIPHHFVMKPDSTTTKLRVVFDASAKCSEGYSLNDNLLIGPKLQSNIFSILLKFRLHSVVFTADIKQMYRQILVCEDHRKYQRIVWRFSPSDELEIYELNTVTYGISSAPYLAIRTILELARINQSTYPRASFVVSTDVYVDDLVSGCSSLQEGKLLVKEITQLLKSGGFELRKWASNVHALLTDVADKADASSLSLDDNENPCAKILGLHWQPDSDCFFFRVSLVERPCTKRTILSDVARIFDPLGLISPLSFFAKRLIQHIWTLHLDWDEVPPSYVVEKWLHFKTQLSSLASLQIPRRFSLDNTLDYQLHGFCDASEAGFAAVIYFRVSSTIKTDKFVVCSKSKVALLKRISIPRLELCAAVLLSELIESVVETFKDIVTFNQIFAWSDSLVALSWIKSSPHKWKTFVSNRVSYIQDKVTPDAWRHVPTLDNPADCASRGLYPAELLNKTLWWAGPDWLVQSADLWPKSVSCSDTSDVLTEEKTISLLATTITNIFDNLLNNFSSLRKIQGIVAYVLRFINRSKGLGTSLSHDELRVALEYLVKHVQATAFSEELLKLNQGKACSKPLRVLAPFIDEKGLMRVGGRLHRSSLHYDAKHPMLLPSKHRLTTLLIEQYHRDNLHPGCQTLHYLLGQQFWILSCRREIKRVIFKCIRCFRVKPRFQTPLMGRLPISRISQIKPFVRTGVDFAGPVTITLGKHRGAKSSKAYISVFVCFATKAIHLELVSSLTSEAFLACFRRFVARRGRCTDLFSDCATNFVGANQMLLEASAGKLAIRWHFNPPSAPHMGGLWEAGVKSVKTHLIRVIGEQILTYEELNTVLIQIEAVLNSRPLCPISSDPNDLSVLTPGHFLTLEPLTAPPEDNLAEIKFSRLNRWQLLVRMHQDFWRRWHTEYLQTLQQRSKWYSLKDDVCENSLVLIKHDNAPTLKWHMGRIVKLHRGADGIARVATVQTASGLFQRPIVKLAILPVDP